MTEEWRSVPGYEGLYEVSSLGRVRSLDRTVIRSDGLASRRKGRVLKKGITQAGYELVVLSKSGVTKSCNVHVLVASSFLPNPDAHPLVRHLNDVGNDNRIDNLCWGTYSENRKDAVASGAYVNQNFEATHCIRNHLFDKENTYLIPSGGRSCKKCRRERDKGRLTND